MKILIDDGMQIRVGTGIGKYSQYLYENLKNIDNIQVFLENKEIKGNNRKLERIKYLLYINSFKYLKKISDYDVVHYTNYAMPFFKRKKVKYVVTIHDLAAYICPQTLSRFYGLYNRFMVKHALKKADAIITVSNSVKNEIGKYFPQYLYKVSVIYPGHYKEIEHRDYDIAAEYDNKKLKSISKHKFFLFVGTIEKRKNLGIVIKAFLKLKEKYHQAAEYKLVLAGRNGFGSEDYLNLAESSDIKEDIIFTGYITKNDSNRLYNEACAYIFPSIYEGFGSTQTECMRCHLPLILSDIPTNREVSKDYGDFFSLDDVEQLVQCMKNNIAQGDYTDKFKLADKYLEEYDWDKLIFKYLDVYRRNYNECQYEKK